VPYYYKIDKEHRVVLTTAFGAVTLADLLAHREQVLNDPDFDPTYSQIVDFTQATKMEVRGQDVEQFAQYDLFSPQSRRALVAPSNEKYGLCRMYATLREVHGETGIRVFHAIDEALDWVFSEGTPEPC